MTNKAASSIIYEQCESIELYSSIAQPVEHAAVNRRVVGSSPTGGARKEMPKDWYLFFFLQMRFEPTSLRSIAAKTSLFGEKRTRARRALSKQHGVLFVAKAVRVETRAIGSSNRLGGGKCNGL